MSQRTNLQWKRIPFSSHRKSQVLGLSPADIERIFKVSNVDIMTPSKFSYDFYEGLAQYCRARAWVRFVIIDPKVIRRHRHLNPCFKPSADATSNHCKGAIHLRRSHWFSVGDFREFCVCYRWVVRQNIIIIIYVFRT